MPVKARGPVFMPQRYTVYICFDWLKDNRLHKL